MVSNGNPFINGWFRVLPFQETTMCCMLFDTRQQESYGYGSIPIHTIFRGMNIHKSQLFWCELQGYYWFWPIPISQQNHVECGGVALVLYWWSQETPGMRPNKNFNNKKYGTSKKMRLKIYYIYILYIIYTQYIINISLLQYIYIYILRWIFDINSSIQCHPIVCPCASGNQPSLQSLLPPEARKLFREAVSAIDLSITHIQMWVLDGLNGFRWV